MQLDQTLDNHRDYGYNDQRTQGYDNLNMHASKHNEHKINACSTSTKRCNGSNQTRILDR